MATDPLFHQEPALTPRPLISAGLDAGRPLEEQNAFDLMHMRTLLDGQPSEGHKGSTLRNARQQCPQPHTFSLGPPERPENQRAPKLICVPTSSDQKRLHAQK